MKKVINNPENVVHDMLSGIDKINPSIVYYPEFEVIVRKERSKKVGLVSGGGSGHEPSHAGFVGYGMLDAVACGNVFASPSADRVLKAIQESEQGMGVLLIIKNYSGDVMNFEMAKDLAEMEGIKVDTVVVKDDVAVANSTYSTGRRGIAGTIFVHKIAGAKAQMGANLKDVKRVAQKVINNVRSIGIAMSSCIIPGVGKPGFTINENEIEIGMGIHGEPGIEKTEMKTSKEIAANLCDKIIQDKGYRGKDVAVMVNGLGGTPLMELYILSKDVNEYLILKGIRPYKYFVGNYMTSMEMAGCSISLLELDDELKKLLSEPCDTMALKVGVHS
ncbi:MAG: dihydroxyacetone kinase subunit DhaK [Eubacteriales bacterium]